MPVTIKNGDLLKAPVEVIVHQANCWNTMASGIARKIREQFPEAYTADQILVRGDIRKLGDFSWGYHKETNQTVCNLYGQYYYGTGGKYTDYHAFRKGLDLICRAYPNKIIGLPMGIGCGLGGGDWNTIFKIINEIANERNATIEIWQLNG